VPDPGYPRHRYRIKQGPGGDGHIYEFSDFWSGVYHCFNIGEGTLFSFLVFVFFIFPGEGPGTTRSQCFLGFGPSSRAPDLVSRFNTYAFSPRGDPRSTRLPMTPSQLLVFFL
jgi:hypothetical protein